MNVKIDQQNLASALTVSFPLVGSTQSLLVKSIMEIVGISDKSPESAEVHGMKTGL